MLSLFKFKPAIYISLLMLMFFAGHKVCSWRQDSAQVNAIKQSQEATQVQIDKNHQQELSISKKKKDYEIKTKEHIKNVTREIVSVPVYRDCIVPVDGVRLINSAIDAANQIKTSG